MKDEMNLENDITMLSVPQVILLCILVTAITTVLTSLVIVRLLVPTGEVPQTVENIINVDKTQKTVVIKEGDLVAKAIADNMNSASAIYIGEKEQRVLLGYGLQVGDNQIISIPYPDITGTVFVQDAQMGYFGIKDIMLWQTAEESSTIDGTDAITLDSQDVHIGQTMVYLGADGLIRKGLIVGVTDRTIEFSVPLQGAEIGMMLDIGGDILGIWTGTQIVRAHSIEAIIDELRDSEIVIPEPASFDVDYRPGDINDERRDADKAAACQLVGGTYTDAEECVDIDDQACMVLGGEFNPCASACRGNTSAGICTAQCVAVCQL